MSNNIKDINACDRRNDMATRHIDLPCLALVDDEKHPWHFFEDVPVSQQDKLGCFTEVPASQ